MKPGARPALALGLILLTLGFEPGCAGSARPGRADDLRRSVEAYNEAYRWKNYARAAAFLPPDLRAPFVASYEEDDKSLHIEGYQVLAVDMRTPEVADIKVRYRYMILPEVTLKQDVVTQHWALVGGSWILEHETGSLRAIDLSFGQPDPDERFGGGPPPHPSMEVEVVGPDGEVVRPAGPRAGSAE